MFKRIRIAALFVIISTVSDSTPPPIWSSYLLSDSEVHELRALRATNQAAFVGAMLRLYGLRH